MQEQLAADGWDVPTYHQGQAEQQYNNLLCPACEGGDSREDNASVKLLHEADGGWCAVVHVLAQEQLWRLWPRAWP